ncbi:MAG: hypothetical protein WC834_03985 [Eubacteriales bacterium]|nr:MAG: hypothetical protein CVV03_11390 [Firmicutes bacterium HGW-Firmicutes-8]
MAEYKVVEVTQFDAGKVPEELEPEQFRTSISEFCPAGWEIISTRLMADNGIHRALVVLSR